MLTIIGGRLKGTRLITPKGRAFRPTLGKTREALFSVLVSRYELSDFTCVDLFAGSGALGFEAISRGTAHCSFIESSRQSVQLLKRNIDHLSLQDSCEVFHSDALAWIGRMTWSQPVLFLIDPPYQSHLAQSALKCLDARSGELQECLIVVESSKKLRIECPPSMKRFQHKCYGNTTLDFFEITSRS